MALGRTGARRKRRIIYVRGLMPGTINCTTSRVESVFAFPKQWRALRGRPRRLELQLRQLRPAKGRATCSKLNATSRPPSCRIAHTARP